MAKNKLLYWGKTKLFRAKVVLYSANPFKLARDIISREGMRRATEESEKIAHEFVEDMRRHIYGQMFEHKPLSEEWLEEKRKRGWDPRILIATREYVESIQVLHTQLGLGRSRVEVGVPNRLHREAKIPLRVLARIHEFGSATQNIPPRPHWRPLTRKYQMQAKQRAKRIAPIVMDPIERVFTDKSKIKETDVG